MIHEIVYDWHVTCTMYHELRHKPDACKLNDFICEAKQLCSTLSKVADRVQLPWESQRVLCLQRQSCEPCSHSYRPGARMDVSAPKALLKEAGKL